MASQDDFLTTQKNGVQGINALVQYFRIVAGPSTISPTIPASSQELITTGTGRIHSVSIPEFSGANQVFIYDAASVATIDPANLIWSSLEATAANFVNYSDVSLFYSRGIVIETDADMTACVGYTPIS